MPDYPLAVRQTSAFTALYYLLNSNYFMRYFRLYCLLLFFLSTQATLQAQEGPWRLGLTAGGSQFMGDINSDGRYAPPFSQNPELQDLSFSAFVEKSLFEGVSLQLRYSQGALEANDRAIDFQGNLQRDAPYFERALNMRNEWYSADLSFRLQTGSQTWLRPYVTLGFGGQYFQTYADLFTENGQRYYYWNDGNIYDAPQGNPNANRIEQDGIFETELQPLSTEQVDYEPWSWQLPLAAGLDVKITNRIFLQLEYRWVLSGSDYLDDVATDYPADPFTNATAAYASNPSDYQGRRGTEAPRLEGNDMYSQVQVGVVFHLGRMQRRFQPPIFYTPPIGKPSNQGVPEIPKDAKTYLDTLLQDTEKEPTTSKEASDPENMTDAVPSSSTTEPTQEEVELALLKSLRAERLKSLELQAELIRLRQEGVPADTLLLQQKKAQLSRQRSSQLAKVATQKQDESTSNDSLQQAINQLKREVRNLQKLAQLPPKMQLDSNMMVTRRAELEVEKELLEVTIERMPEVDIEQVLPQVQQAPGSLPTIDSVEAVGSIDSLKAGPEFTETASITAADQEKIERLDGLKSQLDDMQADLKKQRKRGDLDSAYYAQLQQQMKFLNRVIDQLTAEVEQKPTPKAAPKNLNDETLWKEMQSQRSLLKEQAQTLRELKDAINQPNSQTSSSVDSNQTALDWVAQADVEKLYFPSGKATLNTQQEQQLKNLLSDLNRFPRVQVQLQGYSDTTGTPLENYQLSQERANAVAAYLRKQGIPAERLQVVYFGSTKAKGKDPEERRVELHFNLK